MPQLSLLILLLMLLLLQLLLLVTIIAAATSTIVTDPLIATPAAPTIVCSWYCNLLLLLLQLLLQLKAFATVLAAVVQTQQIKHCWKAKALTTAPHKEQRTHIYRQKIPLIKQVHISY